VKIHQSDMSSFNRCGELHRRQRNGSRGQQLSATAYGSVMHHALHTLERSRDLKLAIDTFEHYWHPLHIDTICESPEIWIGRDSWGSLRAKGVDILKKYWDLKRYDDEEVLALEIPFAVPLHGTMDVETGEPHVLLGTIDRLAVRRYRGREHLCVDDWKSGRKKVYLKHALQFTGYAHATTETEFWTGNPTYLTEGFGEERGRRLMERLASAPRHGWWIGVKDGVSWSDAGVREPRDYRRFLHAVDQYVRAVQNNIFPLNLDGENCQFCPFRDDCPEGLQ
jgi:hypothetical protein